MKENHFSHLTVSKEEINQNQILSSWDDGYARNQKAVLAPMSKSIYTASRKGARIARRKQMIRLCGITMY